MPNLSEKQIAALRATQAAVNELHLALRRAKRAGLSFKVDIIDNDIALGFFTPKRTPKEKAAIRTAVA